LPNYAKVASSYRYGAQRFVQVGLADKCRRPAIFPLDSSLFQKRRFAAFIGNNAFAAVVGGALLAAPTPTAKT
jgi:hypothetical protein